RHQRQDLGRNAEQPRPRLKGPRAIREGQGEHAVDEDEQTTDHGEPGEAAPARAGDYAAEPDDRKAAEQRQDPADRGKDREDRDALGPITTRWLHQLPSQMAPILAVRWRRL